MSLQLSRFDQYITGGSPIDYFEMRLGEAYAIPFTIRDNQTPPQPIDLTGWTFDVLSELYTATFSYGTDNSLTSVTDFTDQGTQETIAGLAVTNIVAAAGQGVLTVPPGVNPNPTTLVTADGNNTLLNIITITATYPSSVSGFNSVRKLLIGLVVRYG